jgi:hypothetical protein
MLIAEAKMLCINDKASALPVGSKAFAINCNWLTNVKNLYSRRCIPKIDGELFGGYLHVRLLSVFTL